MKKVGAYKFNLRHNQNGFVLIFTMSLLLIIATLTITFFYLQFLEVNLIAKETENLQAFYLAEAGLEKGRKLLLDPNTNTSILNELEKKGKLNYNDPVVGSCNQKRLASNSDKEGIFYCEYKLNPNVPDIDGRNIKGIITITGTGWVDDNKSQIGDICKKKSENRREIENRFELLGLQLQDPNDWHDPFFGEMAAILDYPVVMSWETPNIQYSAKITFITVDIEGQNQKISEDQEQILTYSEMMQEEKGEQQKEYYLNYFVPTSRRKMKNAQRMDKNKNKLLFPEERRHLYESTYLTEIETLTHLKQICGDDCPFEDYKEWRKGKGVLTFIYSSSAKLKSTKTITLDPGLYFFEELTLEEGSTINTRGAVSIYVKKLILQKNARLMGGRSNNPEIESPNNLIILSQRWDDATYDPEDGIKIGSNARVSGHIFAPNLKVIICKGDNGKTTKVRGSILTNQLVTSDCSASPAFGPIWIIYSEYIKNNVEEIPGSWREVRNP